MHCFKITFNRLEDGELKYLANFQIKNTRAIVENNGSHNSFF